MKREPIQEYKSSEQSSADKSVNSEVKVTQVHTNTEEQFMPSVLPDQPTNGPSLSRDGVLLEQGFVPWREIESVKLRTRFWGSKVIVGLGKDNSFALNYRDLESAAHARSWIKEKLDSEPRRNLLVDTIPLYKLREIISAIFTEEPFDACLLADLLLAQGILHKASDLHLDRGEGWGKIRFRINGVFVDLARMSPAAFQKLLNRCRVLAQLPTYVHDQPQEGRITINNWPLNSDFRLTIFPTIHGDRASVRYYSGEVNLRALDQLGFEAKLHNQLAQVLEQKHGLLLFTGPANSGKTTSAYACLRAILRARGERTRIVTLEDPVECRLDGISQTSINLTQNIDYQSALTNILRQDPDVLMIGEIRDALTAEITIQAGFTGHLVLSTFHCGSPAEAIIRLLDMGLQPYKVSSVLLAVLGQQLITIPCKCQANPQCELCPGTGVQGRRAEGTWLTITDQVRQLIKQKPMVHELEQFIESDQSSFNVNKEISSEKI